MKTGFPSPLQDLVLPALLGFCSHLSQLTGISKAVVIRRCRSYISEVTCMRTAPFPLQSPRYPKPLCRREDRPRATNRPFPPPRLRLRTPNGRGSRRPPGDPRPTAPEPRPAGAAPARGRRRRSGPGPGPTPRSRPRPAAVSPAGGAGEPRSPTSKRLFHSIPARNARLPPARPSPARPSPARPPGPALPADPHGLERRPGGRRRPFPACPSSRPPRSCRPKQPTRGRQRLNSTRM